MKTIKQIIAQEVYTNISQLINNVVMVDSDHQTEFFKEAVNMTNWDSLIEEIEREIDHSEIAEWLDDAGFESIEDALNSDEDQLREFADDYSIYTDEHEIMEYWVISDWLHGILTDIGYPVSTFQGLSIMCRTTTGQLLECDYVWQKVIKYLNS